MIPTGVTPDISDGGVSTATQTGFGIGGTLSANPWTMTTGDTVWPYTFPSTTGSGASSSPTSTSLPPQQQSSQTTAQPSTSPAHGGISHGALAAAIVVPILVAVAVLILALFLLRRRQRQRRHQSTSSSLSPTTYNEKNIEKSAPPIITSSENNAYYTGLDNAASSTHPSSVTSHANNPPPPYQPDPLNLAIPAAANIRPMSSSGDSITSTLYSDAASIRSARAARMSVGAVDMITHSRSASSSLASGDPFKTGTHSPNSSRHGSVNDQPQRSSEILTPTRGFRENEEHSPVSPVEEDGWKGHEGEDMNV